MYCKIDWNNTTNLPTTEGAIKIAREESKEGDTLFISGTDNVTENIVHYVWEHYEPKIDFHHRQHENEVNLFIFGKKALADLCGGDSFDADKAFNTLCERVVDFWWDV